jgi:hypothetical protein
MKSANPRQEGITPAMIEAGIRALHEANGYQYTGDAEEIVVAIYVAMRALEEEKSIDDEILSTVDAFSRADSNTHS